MRCCTAERCNKSNHPSGSPLNCGRHLNFVTPLGCHCVTPLVFYFVTPLAFTLPRDTARLSPRNTARLPSRDTALRCHVGCARFAGMDDYVPSRRMYTTCTQCTTGVLSKNTTIVIGALRGVVYILFRGLSKNKKYVEYTYSTTCKWYLPKPLPACLPTPSHWPR